MNQSRCDHGPACRAVFRQRSCTAKQPGMKSLASLFFPKKWNPFDTAAQAKSKNTDAQIFSKRIQKKDNRMGLSAYDKDDPSRSLFTEIVIQGSSLDFSSEIFMTVYAAKNIRRLTAVINAAPITPGLLKFVTSRLIYLPIP